MKLAFVITRGDELGGAQVHVRDLVLAAREQGHHCTVLAGAPGAWLAGLADRGIDVVPLKQLQRDISAEAELRAVLELRGHLARLTPDLVALHCSKAGIIGRVAQRSRDLFTRAGSRTPVVLTVHGWSFGQGVRPRRSTLYRLIERAMGRMSDAIITVCEYDRQQGLALGLPPALLRCVHNGVPDTTLRADVEQDPARIVMVARMAPPKRADRLVQALALLQELDWNLDLVGEGPLEVSLRAQVERLGLSDRVNFLGQRDDVERCLANAQIFVLCSDHEGFPLSVIEAMRAGLPVIADKVGGICEAVTHERTGFLIPPSELASGSGGCLGTALEALLRSPEKRAQMGQQGRARYEAKFTFASQLAATLGIYRGLVRGE